MGRISDISDIFHRVVQNNFAGEDISSLPIHTRCRLISVIVEQLHENPRMDRNEIVSSALRRVAKSFDVSKFYYDWQQTRATIFRGRLKQKPMQVTLNTFRHWSKMSDEARKEALTESVRLHQRTFSEGVMPVVPVSHVFVRFLPRRTPFGVSVLFGTFNGSLERGKGKIKQNVASEAMFDDPRVALDTAHHEMAHGIHFSLAYEYHKGRIRADHPLFEEARYFHALEVRGADVPPSIFDAYSAQTFEHLAETEGRHIAGMVYEQSL